MLLAALALLTGCKALEEQKDEVVHTVAAILINPVIEAQSVDAQISAQDSGLGAQEHAKQADVPCASDAITTDETFVVVTTRKRSSRPA